MLRHLPPCTSQYLLSLYNWIWESSSVPEDWLDAVVLPVRKPGSLGTSPKDFRPIALTSCVCKLFERMVNVRLMWFLEHHHLLSPSQFGFRKCRSTTDVLVNLEVYIRTDFAAKTSIVAVLFDLEKAYDTTWRYHILSQLHSFGLRGHLPLFLRSFLSRRSFRVRLGTALSASFQQYEGVPQGSVLSTTLFLVALNGLLSSLPSGVFSALYVDDLTLCCQGDDSPLLQRRLQLAIDAVSSWATDHGFKFSTSKTCAMTFTRKRVVLRPSLSLYGHKLEYKDSAKLLGLFLDTRLSWSPHISYLRVECSKALTLLRVLSILLGGQIGALSLLYIPLLSCLSSIMVALLTRLLLLLLFAVLMLCTILGCASVLVPFVRLPSLACMLTLASCLSRTAVIATVFVLLRGPYNILPLASVVL
ncbi:probable RNA-directed DNA polymerase from transposon BS isoform X2 [Procambarus clarkii]|uniref:probable RNA-directed DNA polymerase from transposon BS isoform X2 n=1 Tax=Procambarus clarkii TaxID=6728 RepID=UPI003743467E